MSLSAPTLNCHRKSILDRFAKRMLLELANGGVGFVVGQIYCQRGMVPFLLLSTFWTHVIEIELPDHLIVLVSQFRLG